MFSYWGDRCGAWRWTGSLSTGMCSVVGGWWGGGDGKGEMRFAFDGSKETVGGDKSRSAALPLSISLVCVKFEVHVVVRRTPAGHRPLVLRRTPGGKVRTCVLFMNITC